MSEAKHTPGPWRTGRRDMQSYDGATGKPFTNIYTDDPRTGTHMGQQLPLVIARVEGEHLGQGEEKANARLIAAAPQLLEACQIAEGWMTQLLATFRKDRAPAGLLGEHLKMLQAAIRAAEE